MREVKRFDCTLCSEQGGIRVTVDYTIGKEEHERGKVIMDDATVDRCELCRNTVSHKTAQKFIDSVLEDLQNP